MDPENRCRGGYAIVVDGKEGNATWPFENAPGQEGDQYMSQVQDGINKTCQISAAGDAAVKKMCEDEIKEVIKERGLAQAKASYLQPVRFEGDAQDRKDRVYNAINAAFSSF